MSDMVACRNGRWSELNSRFLCPPRCVPGRDAQAAPVAAPLTIDPRVEERDSQTEGREMMSARPMRNDRREEGHGGKPHKKPGIEPLI
ncbi:hypothetical protein EYF80_040773 [Liparis tanakae]|uniref:Uncharacterized protein n=1 Tax=Liparis tanakae TaxID=230148 RepID=A0A4Z2G6Y6_9TELE|nr:hypothetical protein EYF80_040773 [Liparis tanakae]